MANRPTTLPLFCTDNPSNREPFPDSLVRSGFLPDQPLPAEYLNQGLGLLGEWVAHMDGVQNSASIAVANEPATRLIGGGKWSYTSTTNTLAWSEAAYIAYPGLADSANTLAAGSVVVPSGSVVYVTTNAPFVDKADTTAGSTTLNNALYADYVVVGWGVSGAGIPAGTTVTATDTKARTVTISAAPTATAAGVRLTYTGSGPLTAQVAPIQSFASTPNMVVIARAIPNGCIVGVGSGQMRLHELESKSLLGTGYQDVQRFTAGEALTAGQFVYICNSTSDGSRTPGSVYGATAAVGLPQRAYVLGVAVNACNAGDTAYVVSEGLLPCFSGLTAGTIYYLSTAMPGVLTATAPTDTGASVTHMGVAVSATSLLLSSGASRRPSIVNPQYPPQSVFMGTWHRAAQSPASSQDFIPFFTTAQDGKLAFRLWTTGAAGHVLRVKVNSVTGFFPQNATSQNVSLRVFRGNDPTVGVLYQTGGQPFKTQSGTGAIIDAFWANIPIGQAAFGAYDAIGLALAFASTNQEVNATGEMSVYTAS